jgi:hypothetical protein
MLKGPSLMFNGEALEPLPACQQLRQAQPQGLAAEIAWLREKAKTDAALAAALEIAAAGGPDVDAILRFRN